MPTPIASTTILACPYMQLQLICERRVPAVSLYLVRSVSRLVAALADTVDVVGAVADGTVHADLLARVVLALGGAHHRGCNVSAIHT